MVTNEQRDMAERITRKNARDVHTWDEVASWAIVALISAAGWVASWVFGPAS